MDNRIPGVIIIKGRIKDIKAFLREQIKREDELGNLVSSGVEILCEKNGLIHYVLNAPHSYYFRDAYPLAIKQTHIAAAANSDDSVVEMVVNVMQRSMADAYYFRALSSRHSIDIAFSCEDRANDKLIYIEISDGKIVEYEKVARGNAA